MTTNQAFISFLEENNLNISDVAKRTGIAHSTLSSMVNNPSGDPTIKTLERIKKVYPHFLHNNEVSLSNREKEAIKLVPYYDIDVTAGNLEVFTGENKEKIHSMVKVPAMMDVDAFVNVSGNSMYNKYCSGDIIGIKKIEHSNFIEWGEAHVIITTDDRRLLKYVRKTDNKEFIILRSENRQENDDIDLPVNLVVSMFIVKGLIRRKTL